MLSISGLFARKTDRRAACDLYEHIRSQSRLPVFYTDFSVSDSLDGRFDILVLHLFLVLNRFEGKERDHPALRCLTDRMIDDLDAALREMGVGDLSVPKKIKALAKAALGRLEAYHAACSGGAAQDAFEKALARNVYRSEETGAPAVRALAGYAQTVSDDLAAQQKEMILSGRVRFPEPAVI
ncbi:MAG: ubiquinol-cytochrome C chaperone family protein [Alphaproteobacteria bacterium]